MVRNVNPDASTQIVSAPQQLTQSSLAEIDQLIDRALASKPSAILLDLSALHTVDSASLNWLLQTQTRLALQQVELRIYNPSETCHDVLQATRLDSRFVITLPQEASAEAGVTRG